MVSCNPTLVVRSIQFGGNYAKLNVGIRLRLGNAASLSDESDAWKQHLNTTGKVLSQSSVLMTTH